jgi:hypothetical protein
LEANLSLPYLPLQTLKLQRTDGNALLLPFDPNADITAGMQMFLLQKSPFSLNRAKTSLLI